MQIRSGLMAKHLLECLLNQKARMCRTWEREAVEVPTLV